MSLLCGQGIGDGYTLIPSSDLQVGVVMLMASLDWLSPFLTIDVILCAWYCLWETEMT
jgi:hypothetical protein